MEKYTEINIDGETLIMEIEDHRITIGNRFEYNVRILLSGTHRENKQKIRMAFDFFRNYACLLKRNELKNGWTCYDKAFNQRSDGLSHAFWNYLSGMRLKRHGKSIISWA